MPGGQSVLIVEDDADLRRLFRTALTVAGFDVHEAADGFAALKFIDRHPFTAVILDLGLPHISGYVVLQELMGQAHTRDIPVVIVTGRVGAERPEGAACLLHKPISPERLIDSVRECIVARGGSERAKG